MVRPRSLELVLEGLPAEATVDGPVALRLVIFNSLKDAGVDTESIEGIECLSKTLWYIVFNTRIDRQKYRDYKVNISGKEYTLSSNEMRTTTRPTYIFVRAYGFPLDADRQTLEQTLGLYGDLIEVVDDVDGRLGIKTGVRYSKYSKLNENIPSYIYAGKHQVRINYRNQPQTCHNCHKEGHNAKDCKAGKVCKQCSNAGHTKGDYPERRCFYCKGKGHELSQCEKYVAEFPGIETTLEVNKHTTQVNGNYTVNDNHTPIQVGNEPINKHTTQGNGNNIIVNDSHTSIPAGNEPISPVTVEHPTAEDTSTEAGNRPQLGTEQGQMTTEVKHTGDLHSNSTTEPSAKEQTPRPSDTFEPPPLVWGGEDSDWDTQDNMETGDGNKTNADKSEGSSATESGEEPPLKASKTKEQTTGEATATNKTKRKKQKKTTTQVQNTDSQNQNPKQNPTSSKRPSIKVSAGKSRHPFKN